MRVTKFLCVLVIFCISYSIFGSETKKMLFVSPILYKPVIQMAFSKNKKSLKKQEPTAITPFDITMKISEFQPDTEYQKDFDKFVQITFKEISNVKFLIFKKNNMVQRLHVVTSDKNIKYQLDTSSILAKVSRKNKEYYDKTQEVILSLLQREQFLTQFPLGEHILTFKLELTPDVSTGRVYFSGLPYYHAFCFYKYRCSNSALCTIKPWTIPFSLTSGLGYISLANLFDSKRNGYECHFYPSQGLKYLLTMKNGKPDGVTAWNSDGTNKRKISFRQWQKEIRNSIKN